MYKIINDKKGFTLIELLLYVGISSTLLLVSSLFMNTLLESRIKNQTIAEVEEQGAFVMNMITQTIRNAESITSPTIGTSANSLNLNVLSAPDDPTVFSISSGAISVTEGGGGSVALTNSKVTASALNFQNFSRAGTPGVIRISFTLTYVNPEGRNEYDFSKTFSSSASLR